MKRLKNEKNEKSALSSSKSVKTFFFSFCHLKMLVTFQNDVIRREGTCVKIRVN